jgi:ribonuclease T2
VRRFRVLAIAALVAVIAATAIYVLLQRNKPERTTSAESSSSVLALTWGPSLCKSEATTSGCRNGHVGKMGRTFVLHGLWPQPATEQYCDIPKKDAGRKSVALPDDIRKRLQDRMSDVNVMAPHEWYAHGSCSGVTPPEYFDISTTLADQANAVLNPLFVKSVGQRVTSRSVRQAFDVRFGSGAGQRVSLTCRGSSDGAVVYEVRLSLPAVTDLRGSGSLGDALARGPQIPPGCGQGRVP